MSETRKKILFVITKSNWGGAQRYVFDLATSLAHTYDVAVASGGEGRLSTILREQHISVVPLPDLIRDVSILHEIRALRALYTLLRTEKPDILHLNSSKAGFLGALAGRCARTPKIIFTAHAWAWNEKRPWYVRIGIGLLHWSTVLLSHRTITVSHAVYDQMARFPFTRTRMRVVHPGITPIPRIGKEQARSQFITRVPELQEKKNIPWIVTVGELHPIKGHRYALEALALLVAEGTPFLYILIGDGEEKENLSQYITTHSLGSSVYLLGHIQDVAALLSAFDLFILPSLSEAFGYVLLEAGASEVPIIASEIGGIPEIIQMGMGTLVPPRNTTLLAEAVQNALQNTKREHTLSLALKTEVGTYFTKERMVKETEDVYLT